MRLSYPYKAFRTAVAALALGAITAALWHLRAETDRLAIEAISIDGTPVTIFRTQVGQPGPVVVIAHGFAGSQQLMLPFATTLAHAGYVAVTFDFPGHGRNPAPLTGSIAREDGATRNLVAVTAQVTEQVRMRGDGRVALLGHSMASDIVVRVAQALPWVATTVAVSMFSPAVTRESPRNLLVIVGGWEGGLRREALRAVGLVSAPEPPRENATYGDVAFGAARRAAVSVGVEHIGVLYARASLTEAVTWLDGVFGMSSRMLGAPDRRGPWILLLLAGVVALAWPASHLLPVVSRMPLGAGLGWRRLWPALVIPAVATPLILRVLPTNILPVLVADYLVAHFAMYGLLTAGCLWRIRSRSVTTQESESSPVAVGALPAGALAVTLYGFVGLVLPIDTYVTSFMPGPNRIVLISAMLIGTVPFFLADEWLMRGPGAGRGAYAASKMVFLLSLGLAVGLDFGRLFFLVIIVPVILLFFLVYGAIGTWAYKRTGHPWVAGIANAIAFAWAIGVTFPLLAG
ncbi:2-succinyl-6-hydroxy-2, 4-cyclohexadiene-1-carboxylate synthase [Methylobacterium mesophilicum]|uniref:alpha/beta hydrolase n=1 Tax=Methylobacterium mesophilicum TaxID=39956 RepID=UPI00207E4213|nr:2-succinyl-6-hydroxy-2, 4-cyclohexadiene-1-carboxylate synthase [Methylobacterium mesophilicum]